MNERSKKQPNWRRRTYLAAALNTLLLSGCGRGRGNSDGPASHSKLTKKTMSNYAEKLGAQKAHYPFARWATYDLEGYTEEACDAFAKVFDKLIAELSKLGPDASESSKIAQFKAAVLALNKLDHESGLIESGERDELVDLINKITVAVGIDPQRYGHGEGPASEWREW